jgi:hypothetical protein
MIMLGYYKVIHTCSNAVLGLENSENSTANNISEC